MIGVTRRYYALAALAALAVAAGAAAIVVFVAGVGNGGGKTLTRKEYLDRIQAICRVYDRKLQRISLPTSPGNAQALAQSIGQALPLIEARLAETRKVKPPPQLAEGVRHWFSLTDAMVRNLKTSRRAALANDAGGAIRAFGQFLLSQVHAVEAGDAVGFTC